MSLEEALSLHPQIQAWVKANGRKPQHRTEDVEERKLADALLVLQKAAGERKSALAAKENTGSATSEGNDA